MRHRHRQTCRHLSKSGHNSIERGYSDMSPTLRLCLCKLILQILKQMLVIGQGTHTSTKIKMYFELKIIVF